MATDLTGILQTDKNKFPALMAHIPGNKSVKHEEAV